MPGVLSEFCGLVSQEQSHLVQVLVLPKMAGRALGLPHIFGRGSIGPTEELPHPALTWSHVELNLWLMEGFSCSPSPGYSSMAGADSPGMEFLLIGAHQGNSFVGTPTAAHLERKGCVNVWAVVGQEEQYGQVSAEVSDAGWKRVEAWFRYSQLMSEQVLILCQLEGEKMPSGPGRVFVLQKRKLSTGYSAALTELLIASSWALTTFSAWLSQF